MTLFFVRSYCLRFYRDTMFSCRNITMRNDTIFEHLFQKDCLGARSGCHYSPPRAQTHWAQTDRSIPGAVADSHQTYVTLIPLFVGEARLPARQESGKATTISHLEYF